MLKNLTIGKKLALGFGVVLILLTLVGGLSFRGVGGMGADAKGVIAKNELVENLTRKEIDHLNWAKQVFTTRTKPSLHKVQQLLGKASEQVHAVVAKTNEGMMASARSTKLSVTVLSVVAVLVGIVGAILIARGIITALTRIIAGLREGAEQVAAASSQVSAASQSLAEGATEQAAGLEETSSSLEEMSSMTQQNAANAEESASASEELSAQAESMKEVVSQLVTLVGGAAQYEGNGKAQHAVSKPKLLHSDHVFHKIAEERPTRENARPVKIARGRTDPLGDDDELKPFTT